MQRLLNGFQHVESEMLEGTTPAIPAEQWAAKIMWGVAQQMGYVASEPRADGAGAARFADWAYDGAPPPIPAPAPTPNPEPEAEGSAPPVRASAPRQLMPEHTRMEIALVKAAVEQWELGGKRGPRPEWATVVQKEAARKLAEERLENERVRQWIEEGSRQPYEEWGRTGGADPPPPPPPPPPRGGAGASATREGPALIDPSLMWTWEVQDQIERHLAGVQRWRLEGAVEPYADWALPRGEALEPRFAVRGPSPGAGAQAPEPMAEE